MSHDPQPIADPDGPRRPPYVLRPIPCRHRAESRRMILRAAEQAVPGRAAVLGAGPCDDIPLAELAARFAHVTLNDIDREPVDNAVAQVDPAGREKLAIHVADLTGLTEPLLEKVEQQLKASTDPQSAIDSLADVLDNCPRGSFPIPGHFDLVVASGVLSQLHFALAHRSGDLFRRRFPGQLDALRSSTRWTASLERLARKMEAKFVNDLAALTAPGGLVYLSDSVQMCYVQWTPEGQWQTAGTFRMLRSRELKDYLDERFSIVERANWEWVVSPPGAVGQTGRVYDVHALLLRLGAS